MATQKFGDVVGFGYLTAFGKAIFSTVGNELCREILMMAEHHARAAYFLEL